MKIFTISSISVLVVITSFLCYKSFQDESKWAYVNNSIILSEYKGIKDGQKEMDARIQSMQQNLDSLSKQFNRRASSYDLEKKSLSKKEQGMTEESLRRDQAELLKYKKQLEQSVAKRRQELSTASINQINQFIKDYGDKHGYDLVLGVTSDGNILYADESKDITKEVLEVLNKEYTGK